MTETVNEIIARAIAAKAIEIEPNWTVHWPYLEDEDSNSGADVREIASAVIEDLASAGYGIVPVEPTDAMIKAATPYEGDNVPEGREREFATRVQAVWRAMIESAAPGYLDRRRALKRP